VTRDNGDSRVSRRRLLELAGSAAAFATLAGCSTENRQTTTQTESPGPGPGPSETGTSTTHTPSGTETTGHALQFDHVVDMVEAGADDTGTEPVDALIEKHAADHTLLRFPQGEYLLTKGHKFSEFTNLGFVGDGATLVPRGLPNGYLFVFGTEQPGNATGLLFRGFEFDYSASDSGGTALNVLVDDGVYVRDVSVHGPQRLPRILLGVAVMKPDGTGVVERLHFPDGAPAGGWPVGIFVHRFHVGDLTFRDCRVEHFPNNGLYASEAQGPVKVEGGRFRNNDISQVRLGSRGSYARNVEVVVDAVRPKDRNQRGIWLRHPDGVEVDGCTVRVEESTGTAIHVEGGRAATLKNTDVTIDASRYALNVVPDSPTGTGHVTVDNLHVTGSATGEHVRYAVQCNRDNTRFRNVRLHQVDRGRAGIRIGGRNCVIDGGSWVAARNPIAVAISRTHPGDTCLIRLENVGNLRATTVSNPGSRLHLDGSTGGSNGTSYCVTTGVLGSQSALRSQDFTVVINELNKQGAVGRILDGIQ